MHSPTIREVGNYINIRYLDTFLTEETRMQLLIFYVQAAMSGAYCTIELKRISE